MDQRIRLIAAAAVMLAGLAVAMCFRRGAGDTAMTIPAQADSLAAQKPADLRSIAANQLAPPPRLLPGAQPQGRTLPPTVVKPNEQPAAPPELPKSYPAPEQTVNTRWGASMAPLPIAAPPSPPMHKIVDGDTLASLAERYLGSESRAMEIYQANRDVLAQPGELPIGVELKIPRADQTAGAR